MLDNEARFLRWKVHGETTIQEPGRCSDSGRILANGRPTGLIAEDLSIHSKTKGIEPTWVGDVIHFWFEELEEARWFAIDDDIDTRIRDRFLTLHEHLVMHDGLGMTEPRPILAAVIVLDQFSRNMFRGNLRAYSADSIARRLARSAIDQGFDMAMTKVERLFLYLPFEHSEDREDQALSLNLIERLGNENWTGDTMEN